MSNISKAFIFDWSGVLNDNFHCFVQVCTLMFQKYNLEPISSAETQLNFDTPYMKFWNKYIPQQTQEEHHKLYGEFMSQIAAPELYHGVDMIIRYLHAQNYKIIILSSDNVSQLMMEVEKSNLVNLFTKVIGGVHDKKETLISLIQEFELDKEKTFYVGDTAGDVEAGKYAGLKTIGISWGFQHKNVLVQSNPDFLIDDIIKIKEIV
jgi:phosphoglycolate phosphatase